LLFIHPIIQLSAVMLTLYVFYLGVQRFRSLHLPQKTLFRWNRHVLLGKISLLALLGGMMGGMTMVYLYLNGFLMTGIHGKVAFVMIPFIVFGGMTGIYMDRNKNKRTGLPLIHGLSNLVVLILALTQVVTGWRVYMLLVLAR
jgi:predicted MFS family arabinose efflux permease